MAKSIYIGVDGKARKAKNIYIGVDGKARKVKKMYIGVNGVARLCYTSDTLKTYTYTINQPTGGTITVTVDGVAHTSTFTVQHGKTASNKCTPNSGYTFKTFTLSGSYQTASANTLAINGDAEIGAVLEKEDEDV